jgi:hypothetical protein
MQRASLGSTFARLRWRTLASAITDKRAFDVCCGA